MLEDEAQATVAAAVTPARPRSQHTVYCRGQHTRAQKEAHTGTGPSGLCLRPARTTVILIRAILAVHLKVTAMLKG